MKWVVSKDQGNRNRQPKPARAVVESLESRQLLSSDAFGEPSLPANWPAAAADVAAAVEVAQPIATRTTVAVSSVAQKNQDLVTLTATVTAADQSRPVSAGVVAFFDFNESGSMLTLFADPATGERKRGTLLGAANLSSEGKATLDVSWITPGSHSVAAVFQGNTTLLTVANPAAWNVAVLGQDESLTLPPLTHTAVYTKVPFRFALVYGKIQLTPLVTPPQIDGDPRQSVSIFTNPDDFRGGYGFIRDFPATSAPVLITSDWHEPWLTRVTEDIDLVIQPFEDTPAMPPGPADFESSVSAKLSVVVRAPTEILLSALGEKTRTNPPVFEAGIVSGGQLLGVGTGSIPWYGGFHSATAVLGVQIPAPPEQPGDVRGMTSWNPVGRSNTIPHGRVTFMEGKKVLATVKVQESGYAYFHPKQMSLGYHTIKAYYSGDSNFLASQKVASVRVLITLATSYTDLAASSQTVAPGDRFTLTATVENYSDFPVPSGLVTFKEGKRTLATVRLGSDEDIALQLSVGRHVLRAYYEGDKNYLGSKSALLTITVVRRSPKPNTTE